MVALRQPLCPVSVRPQSLEGLSGGVHHRRRDGAVASLDVVWDIADTFNGLMAIPNFIALFALSGVVAKLTKEYFFDKNKLTK